MDSAHRWVGVGHSAAQDSRVAGRTAARRALRGADPSLLIVFASRVSDPAEMLAGIAEVYPDVPLIGSSSELLINPDSAGLHGVTVTALGGPGFTARTAAGDCRQGAQRASGATVASIGAELALPPEAQASPPACASASPPACASASTPASSSASPPDPASAAVSASAVGGAAGGDVDPDHGGVQRVLMMLTDAWVADQEEILAGAYSVIGASMPMIGGSASPDDLVGRPYQLYGTQVLHEAVVGAVIATDGPLGFGVCHGWRKVGEPMIVTRSVKGEVYTLDDRPAMTAYLDRYAAPGLAYTDATTFEMFARSRPIGVRRRHGVEVRSISCGVGPLAAGRLHASGEVPEGGLVWPMEGDADSAVAAAGQACRDAVQGLEGAPALGLLAFDCVSRCHMLGPDGTRREVRRMVEQSRGAPITGLYTWGEIMRTQGMNGYHNQTLAVLALG